MRTDLFIAEQAATAEPIAAPADAREAIRSLAFLRRIRNLRERAVSSTLVGGSLMLVSLFAFYWIVVRTLFHLAGVAV